MPDEPITIEAAVQAAEALCELLPFAPRGEIAQGVLADEIFGMCSTMAQARWLIKRVVQVHGDAWPGISEIRGIFCFTYPPKDGISAVTKIALTSDKPEQRQAPLPKDRLVSADPEFDAAIRKLSDSKRMVKG